MITADLASGDKIFLWSVPLGGSTESVSATWPLLSRAEQERAKRFRNARHRHRWIIAHGVLRKILSELGNCEPGKIEFAIGEYGKPSAVAPSSAVRWHFNLSHSHEIALIGATTICPIGVDIEYSRQLPELDSIARRVFCDREFSDFDALQGESRIRGFYNGWTRKESIIKATGKGFGQSLQAIDVTLKPDDDAAVRSYEDGDAANWQLHDVTVADGYTAAFAVRSRKLFELEIRGHEVIVPSSVAC